MMANSLMDEDELAEMAQYRAFRAFLESEFAAGRIESPKDLSPAELYRLRQQFNLDFPIGNS